MYKLSHIWNEIKNKEDNLTGQKLITNNYTNFQIKKNFKPAVKIVLSQHLHLNTYSINMKIIT